MLDDDLDPRNPGTIPLTAASENGAGLGTAPARRSHRAQPSRSRPGRRRWPIVTAALVVLMAVVAVGGYLLVQSTQGQYYLADDNGQVVIYRGIPDPAKVFWVRLSHVYAQTGISLSQVPANDVHTVTTAYITGSLAQVQQAAANIRTAVDQCRSAYQAVQAWVVKENKYQAELRQAHASHKPVTGIHSPGADSPSAGPMCRSSQAFGIEPSSLSPAPAGRS
jgi:hypothetical protein